MDYEKLYKEALERAKEWFNMGEPDSYTCVVESIFPELSESEDEKIRKEIISALKYANHKGIYDKHIAWLEKQGKQEQLYIRFGEIPTDEKSKIYQGEIEVGTENGVSVYPAFETSDGDIVLGLNLPISKTSLHTQQHLLEYDNRPCYLVSGDYVGKGTDGEPLIKNVSIIKKIDNYRVKEEIDKPNKVKPKFNEGDWIVDNNSGGVYQITEIRNNEYCLWPLDAEIMGYLKIIDVDNDYHLWTINDAKPGDILSDGTMIVIFKRLEESAYREHIVAYVGLDTFGNIQITNDTWELGQDKVKPATNEQCDLLFKKMKEVGCKFNNNTKKLETIDNNELFKYINYENYRRKSKSL